MKHNFTPAYYQIKQDIKEKISKGTLKAGEALPGRNTLADEYGCSWGTLNRAVNELILEGILTAQKGKGTFVSTPVSTVITPHDKIFAPPVKIWLCNQFPSTYNTLAEMMEGMREGAAYRRRSIEFLDSITSHGEPRNLTGYIVVTPSNAQFAQLQSAWQRGERFVVLNSDFENARFATINSNIYEATVKAIQYLIDYGHRKIGLLGIRYGFSNYEQRIDACRMALGNVGIAFREDWIVKRMESHEKTKQLFADWLEHHPECTAIFAADYTSALILMEIIQERGIRIPEELSLFVSGETPSASMLKVSLTTLVQPFHELGKRAVDRLLDEQWALGTERLPCQFRIRESVATPKKSIDE